MRINVSKYFRKALERHRAVVVQEIGLFYLTHRSASVDHPQSAINPPIDAVAFEGDGHADAITFSDFLAEMLDISAGKAEKLVSQWTDRLRAELAAAGRVELNGLGVLRTGPDKLEWTSHSGEAFALQAPWPVLYFDPVKSTGDATAVTDTSTTGRTRPIWFWIAGIAAALMLILALAYWTVYQSPERPVDWSGVDQSRVNKSPRIDSYYVRDTHLPPETTAQRRDRAGRALEEAPLNNPEPSSPGSVPEEEDVLEEDENGRSVPHQGEGREESDPDCIIIVGSFAKHSNVVRMLDVLREKGYTTYTEMHDTLTRVGLRSSCVDEDLLATLRACKIGVEEDAWILGRRPQ